MNQHPQESQQAGGADDSGESPQPQDSGAPQAGTTAVPPEELKPWYYQYWFLYPTIIFWPLWPVLILRSPWHNGMVSGSVAWAMLISGSYIFYRMAGGAEAFSRVQTGDQWALVTLQIILPGILLTLITQAHWIKNRRRIKEAALLSPVNPATSESAVSGAPTRGRRRTRSVNRRGGRRRR